MSCQRCPKCGKPHNEGNLVCWFCNASLTCESLKSERARHAHTTAALDRVRALTARMEAMGGVLKEYADGRFPNGDIVAVSVQAFARRALEAGKGDGKEVGSEDESGDSTRAVGG